MSVRCDFRRKGVGRRRGAEALPHLTAAIGDGRTRACTVSLRSKDVVIDYVPLNTG